MRRPPSTTYALDASVVERIPWFRQQLLAWFDDHKRSFPWREPGTNPYVILIAEILLQRTPATQVARFLPAFIQRYPSWDSLITVPPNELETFLTPLGLARVKAQILKSLAKAIYERGGNIPASHAELEQYKGIGQYTTSVVLSTIHGHVEAFIDVNMARVLERFFGARIRVDIRDDSYLHTLAHQVVEGERNLHVNWAILDHSALVCRSRLPRCLDCPVKAKCNFFKNNSNA